MLKNYLTIFIRNLVRNVSFSIINITGLAIGIACCIVILVFARYEKSFDAFHPQAENTFRVVQHTKFPDQTLYWNTTAYPLAEALRNDFSEFKTVTLASGPVNHTFSIDDGTGSINRFEEQFVLFVDPWYHQVFDIKWIAGNPQTALKDPNSAVLTESFIQKSFHNGISNPAEVLGKTILLNGKDPLIVTGIVKDVPGNVNLHYNILIPYAFFKIHNEYYANNWSGNYQGTTFVVLNNKASETTLEQKIESWKKKYLKPEDNSRISYFLQPLTEIHNEALYGSSLGSYTMSNRMINAGIAVALFILLIASMNFINLTTAMAATRAKEVGIRKIMGGTRFKLILQFVREHTLLIIITLFVSVALSQVFIVRLNSTLDIINLKLSFQWSDLGLIGLVGLCVILLSALYPAVVLSSFKPADALKNKSLANQTNNGLSFRKVLIVFQFSIVQFFIIATIVIMNQMEYVKSKDLGFTKETVIMTPAPSSEKLESFRQKMLMQSTVTDVSFGSGPPTSVYGTHYGTSFRLTGQSEEESKDSEMKVGDLNYVDFYELQLLAGRKFNSLKASFDEFIVNEKLIQAMGWKPQEALGKKLKVNEGEGTIVGVLKDFHNTSLQSEITPCIMYNWIYFQDFAFIKIQTQSGLINSLTGIENIWKEFSSEGVYRYSFLDDLMEINYAAEKITFQGFIVFSAIAILIGCLGLLGLMSFMTTRKTKEIGIRKVLGASATEIITLFSKEFAWLLVIAFCVASPLVYYVMEEWLANFSYRISMSWWIFTCGGITGFMIAMITISFQSLKASWANPIDSLRNE